MIDDLLPPSTWLPRCAAGISYPICYLFDLAQREREDDIVNGIPQHSKHDGADVLQDCERVGALQLFWVNVASVYIFCPVSTAGRTLYALDIVCGSQRTSRRSGLRWLTTRSHPQSTLLSDYCTPSESRAARRLTAPRLGDEALGRDGIHYYAMPTPATPTGRALREALHIAVRVARAHPPSCCHPLQCPCKHQSSMRVCITIGA